MSVDMNRQIQMIDLTQGDEPVITYVDNPRPPLAEMSSQPSSRRARASTKRRLTGVEQFSESIMNTMRQPPELVVSNTSEATNISDRRRRKRRRREEFRDAIQGLGSKRGNPWISHVKAFAKQNNISYRDALKHPKTKSSYQKGGNIFNPIDGFKAGYKFGYNTLGPALVGKK